MSVDRRRRVSRQWWIVGIGVGAAACSGGGGEEDRVDVVTAPIVTSAAERNANFGVGLINAPSAYAEGAGGQGVTVAVIDSGVDPDHPDLAANLSNQSFDVVNRGSTAINSPHGTAVAGVIAAVADEAGVVGVAPRATLLSGRADRDDGVGNSYFYSDIAQAIDVAVSRGASIINLSQQGDPIDATLREAMERAVDAGVLLTIAAGNFGDADPTAPGSFAAEAGADGLAIVVGAVDRNSNIWSDSNRAGSSADVYLAAPGVGVTTTLDGGGYGSVDGTSFAAPHVAGAAAALKSAFPSLTMLQIADLLRATARDLGAAGIDPVYGRGLVDLAEALSAQGAMGLATGATVEEVAPLAESSIEPGPALGDALDRSAALAGGMALDAYGRPYAYDYRSQVRVASIGLDPAELIGLDEDERRSLDVADSLGAALGADRATLSLSGVDGDGAGDAAAWTEDRGAFGRAARLRLDGAERVELDGARFGWSEGASRLDLALGERVDGVARPAGHSALFADRRHASLAGEDAQIEARRRLLGGLSLDLEAGGGEEGWRAGAGVSKESAFGEFSLGVSTAREADGALGFRGEGGFAASDVAPSHALGVGWRARMLGLDLAADLEWAWSAGASGDGIALRDVGASAFGVSASRENAVVEGDRLTFAVRQPLRAESGRIDLSIPETRDLDGAVQFRDESRSARPSGREIDVELGWSIDLERWGDVEAKAGLALDPGHSAQADPAFAAGVRWGLRF